MKQPLLALTQRLFAPLLLHLAILGFAGVTTLIIYLTVTYPQTLFFAIPPLMIGATNQ